MYTYSIITHVLHCSSQMLITTRTLFLENILKHFCTFPVDWAAISTTKTNKLLLGIRTVCICLDTFFLFPFSLGSYNMLYTVCLLSVWSHPVGWEISPMADKEYALHQQPCERARWGVSSNSSSGGKKWIKQKAREETHQAVIGLCGFSWPPFYWRDNFFSKLSTFGS